MGIDIELELFKNSHEHFEHIPKITAKTILHNIDIFLSDFTYDSIQRIGNCFSLPQHGGDDLSLKKGEYSKAEVMKGAKKIGIVFEQTGNEHQRNIAVLNGPYLYLYKDKKDPKYSQYFFLKNAQVETNTVSDVSKKPFEVTFKNAVNVVKLGFEKK